MGHKYWPIFFPAQNSIKIMQNVIMWLAEVGLRYVRMQIEQKPVTFETQHVYSWIKLEPD